jgi:hypothetical protein
MIHIGLFDGTLRLSRPLISIEASVDASSFLTSVILTENINNDDVLEYASSKPYRLEM